MSAERRLCTFQLGDLWFGVNVQRVREVVPPPAITPVPRAPIAVAGLINLRGQILTVIDLGKWLGFEPGSAALLSTMVVAGWENSLVGLLAGQIGEVVAAPESGWETAPANLPASWREVVPEVCKFPGRLLHLLDLDKVLGDGETQQDRVKPGPSSADGIRRSRFSRSW